MRRIQDEESTVVSSDDEATGSTKSEGKQSSSTAEQGERVNVLSLDPVSVGNAPETSAEHIRNIWEEHNYHASVCLLVLRRDMQQLLEPEENHRLRTKCSELQRQRKFSAAVVDEDTKKFHFFYRNC